MTHPLCDIFRRWSSTAPSRPAPRARERSRARTAGYTPTGGDISHRTDPRAMWEIWVYKSGVYRATRCISATHPSHLTNA